MRARRDFPFAFPASATGLPRLLLPLPHSETAGISAAADTRDGASRMQIAVVRVVVVAVAAAGPRTLDSRDITVAVDSSPDYGQFRRIAGRRRRFVD